jgi:diguanylate cyclase (GGDEF)-like protein/PAS domain S-box-containing protein
MVGRNAMDFVHSEDQPALRDGITAIRAGGLEGVMYFRHLRPDGSWLWVEAHARVFASAGAEAANHRVVVLRDATATKAAERKLQDALKGMEEKAEASRRALAGERESEARFQLLAEHSGDVIALSDLHGVRSYVSPAAERVLGWRPDQMVGRGAMEFAHPADQHVLRNALAAMQGGESERSWCIRHLRPDGSWLWVEAHARVLAREDADAPNRYVAVLRDATATKAGERKLRDALAVMEQLAATDELTGLANRRLFGDAVTREWGRCARYGHPLSVLLLDADRFKDFNDRYGHLAGDECLRAIASQLSDAGRRTWDLAARYGGEEFVLLLPNTDHEGALQVARRVGELVKNLAIIHDGNTGHGVVTVSVGVATALPGSPASAFASVSAMLSAADAALYRAKNEGRNRVRDATGNG